MWCVLFNILVSSSTLVLTTHWTVVTPLWLFSNFNEGNLMKSVTIAKCENECIPLARAPVTPPLWPRPLRSRSPDPTVGAHLASYINPPSSLVAVKITFSTALTAAVSHIKKIGRCLCVRYVINRYRSDLARSLMSRSEHISIRIVSRILRKKDGRSVAVTFRPLKGRPRVASSEIPNISPSDFSGCLVRKLKKILRPSSGYQLHFSNCPMIVDGVSISGIIDSLYFVTGYKVWGTDFSHLLL